MLKQKQEYRFAKDSYVEPWRVLNDVAKEHMDTSNRNDYLIVMNNITDCNKYPDQMKAVMFNWKTLTVVVYREPEVKVYQYENYTNAVKNIKGNVDKFKAEGLKVETGDNQFARLDLLVDIEKKHKIKEITKGTTTIKVGDFLSTHWGYDQTNVELFTVKRIIGKNYLIIQEVAKSVREDYFTSTAVKVAPTITKVDIPIKAYISNEGYMSVCEGGYKRGLSLTSIDEEHHETDSRFGH